MAASEPWWGDYFVSDCRLPFAPRSALPNFTLLSKTSHFLPRQVMA